MKKSKYNFFYEEKDRYYLYNAITGAFAELDEDNYKFYNHLSDNEINEEEISEKDLDTFEKLKRGHYILNDDFNEINFIRSKYNSAQFNNGNLTLTIAPTLDCNFRCPYCYESLNPHSFNEDHVNKVIQFIELWIPRIKHLSVTWYGGEPLLEVKTIILLSEKIRQICKDNNVTYVASMITNGYLLTEEIADRLAGNDVKRLQITVDGPKHLHNKTRILADGSGSYDHIIENIEKNCDKFKISVRINVSKKNQDYLEDLLVDLKERNLHKRISVYVAAVEPHTDEAKRFEINCISKPSFSKIKVEFFDLAFNMGFKVRLYPRNLLGGCSASGSNSFVIAGDGKLYKCWHSVGHDDEAVGSLDNIGKFKYNLYDWLAYSPLNHDECLNCKVLPLCMGRCPHYWVIQGKKPQCSEFKYNLEEVLKTFKRQEDFLKQAK